MTKKLDKRSMTPEEAVDMLLKLREDVNIIFSELRDIRAVTSSVDGDPFLGTRAVCKYLNISDRMLRRYRLAGKIAVQYTGRKCQYRRSEVYRFLKEVLKVEGRQKLQ